MGDTRLSIVLKERLGHASIQTTLDIYSHVAPGLQEAAIRFEDMLTTPGVKKKRLKMIISKF